MASISYYAAQYYTVVVSWEGSKYIAVDFYKLSFNTIEQTFHTNMTSIQLDWPYNTALMLSLSALNCIGSSKERIKEIFIGKVIVKKSYLFIQVAFPQLGVLLPVPLSVAVSVSSPVPG